MPTQSLQEVLSRLNIKGATAVGGSDFANYLVVTRNSDGQIDPSLFSSTLSFYEETSTANLPTSAKIGEIAIVTGTGAFVYDGAAWQTLSYLNTNQTPFIPGSSGLVSLNIQDALTELAERAVLIDNPKTVTTQVTFDTGVAPFTIGSTSVNKYVAGLVAQYIGDGTSIKQLSDLTNASNLLTGTIASTLLSGTYPISITGSSLNSLTSNTANVALSVDVAGLNNGGAGHTIATSLLSGTYPISITGVAAQSTTLNDGTGIYRSGSYYLNLANLTGNLPATSFNDTTHGLRGAGTDASPLHSLAVPDIWNNLVSPATLTTVGTPGFISSSDQYKLNTVSLNAEQNQNAFGQVKVGLVNAPALTPTDVLTLVSGNSNISIVLDPASNTLTFSLNTSGISHSSLANLFNPTYYTASVTPFDDHPQYITVGDTQGVAGRTIKAIHTFNTGTTPFNVVSASRVDNLNVQYLSGHEAGYFTDIANIGAPLTGESYPSWFTTSINTAITNALTASGLTFTNITTSGTATVSGNLTAEAITVSGMAGLTTGNQVIGIDPLGNLTALVNTDALSDSTSVTNKWATRANVYSFLTSGAIPIIKNTSGATGVQFTFAGSGDATTISATVPNLTTAAVTDVGNNYVTQASVYNVLNLGNGLVVGLSNLIGVDSSVLRLSSSGAIAYPNIPLTIGAVSMDSGTSAQTNDAIATTGASALITKSYLDEQLALTQGLAISDLPYVTTDELAALTVIEPGTIKFDGTDYYVYTADPLSTVAGTWISLSAPESIWNVKEGLISGEDLGKLIKTCYLTDSIASAPIFLPAIRVAEPINAGGATDPQWKKYFTKSIQTRGQANLNYLVLLRVKGYVKPQHEATLTYATVGAGNVLTYTTVTLNSNTESRPAFEHPQVYQYIDQVFPLVIAGRTAVQLSLVEYDGLFGAQATTSFPGIPPFTTGTALATFNGEFIYAVAEGVATIATNRPYSAYTPDLLLLQYDGEAISGGLSSYAAIPSSTYDGEPIVDSQDSLVAFNTQPIIGGTDYASGGSDPHYVLATGNTVAKYEKARLRSNYSVFNKLNGFSGFLRTNNIVASPSNITKPLSASSDITSIIALVTSHAITQDIPAGSLSLDDTGALTAGWLGTASIGSILNTINSLVPSHGCRATYDPVTDKVTISLANDSPDADPSYSFTGGQVRYDYATSQLFNVLRISFSGSQWQPGTTGVSLPCASGLRPEDALSVLNLATPIGFIATTIGGSVYGGSFNIDGKSITYLSTNTLTGTSNSIDSLLTPYGYKLEYIADANQVTVRRISGTDIDSLLAPRIYDEVGSLASSLGLEKDSFGNKDLPIEAVHKVLYQEDGIWVGGNFKNYNGAVSNGIIKLDLNGRVDKDFNAGLGFDNSIRTIVPVLGDNTNDLLVAGPDIAGLNGMNQKAITRIKQTGVENTATLVNAADISLDGQNKVLDIISFEDGYFAVLTPRQLQVRSGAGALVTTYGGTQGFHGMTKYQTITDVGVTKTLFLLASQAYTSPGTSQKFITETTPPTLLAEPLGLRLMTYDHSNHTIYIDPTWASTPVSTGSGSNVYLTAGAGTGAEASCAYPVVGGFNSASTPPYVVCGNNGIGWGSGETTFPGNVSWNQREAGNLLLYSSDLSIATMGSSPVVPVWTETDVNVTPYQSANPPYSVIENSGASNSDIGYITQIVNVSQYQPFEDQAASPNTGSIGYVFTVDIAKDSNSTVFPYIGLQMVANPEAYGSNSFETSCVINTSTGALGSVSTNGPLSTITSAVKDANTWRVTISVVDQATPNNYVIPIIYPAYTSIFNGGSKMAVQRSITIYGASLGYASWSPNPYVQTTTGPSRPAAGDHTAFQGVYKIALESENGNEATYNRGKAWDGFRAGIAVSEPQAHPVIYGVDSLDRIYVGGPISSLDAGVHTVSPWRLYRLSPLGAWDPTFMPIFDGDVTSCTITPTDQLIVGGKFNSYNRTAANKLVFLTTDGSILNSLAIPDNDVITSATTPSITGIYATNIDRMWLDISQDPPILKVYNNAVTPPGWVSVVDATRALPSPIISSIPANTNYNVSDVAITMPGGFTVRDSIAACTGLNDVYIQCTLGTNSFVYSGHIASSIVATGSYLLSAIACSPITNTVTGNNLWANSAATTFSFTNQDATGVPTIAPAASQALTGQSSYVGVTIQATMPVGTTSTSISLWYYTYPTGSTDPGFSTIAQIADSAGSITATLKDINSNTIIVAKAKLNDRRESLTVVQEVDVTLPIPTISYNASTHLISITSPISLAGYALLYSLDGTAPTINNYTAPGTTVLISSGTVSILDTSTSLIFNTSNQTQVKAEVVYSTTVSGVTSYLAETNLASIATHTYTRAVQPAFILSDIDSGLGINTGNLSLPNPGSLATSLNIYTNVLDSASTLVKYQVTPAGSSTPGSLTAASITPGTHQFIPLTFTAGANLNTTGLNIRNYPTDGITLPSDLSSVTLYLSGANPAITTISDTNGYITGFVIIPAVSTDTIYYNFTGAYSYPARTGSAPANGTQYAFMAATDNGGVANIVITAATSTTADTYSITDTTAHVRYTLPIINIDIATASNSNPNFNIYVIEYLPSNSPYQDTFYSTSLSCYQPANTYLIDQVAGDVAQITTTSTSNQLTYNTSNGDILGIPTFLTSVGTNAICKITYNTTSIITSASTPDVTVNAGTTTTFTPGLTAVNNPGNSGVVINLRFYVSGYAGSYQYTYNVGMKLPPVTFSPSTGSNLGLGNNVTLSNSLATATIYYTLGGTSPTNLSPIYTSPITIRAACSISAYAVKTGWISSTAVAANYLINNNKVADTYGLINLKCGKQLNEVQVASVGNASETILNFNLDGTLNVAGKGALGTSDTNTIPALVEICKGKGIVGLTNNDYWNALRADQAGYWLDPRDATGFGNVNKTLQVRPYYGVTEAMPYFGDNITSISDAGAKNITSLENSGLTSIYYGPGSNSNILLHVKGLNPGKYLVLAYGQKTEFDLDVYSGACPVKTATTKGFYNFGYPIYDGTEANQQMLYPISVFPIRAFVIKGIKKVSTGNYQWLVTQAWTGYIPYSVWAGLKNGDGGVNILNNQTFIDEGSYSSTASNVLSSQGIIFEPNNSAWGYSKNVSGIIPNSNSTTLADNANVGSNVVAEDYTQVTQLASTDTVHSASSQLTTAGYPYGVTQISSPSAAEILEFGYSSAIDIIAIAPAELNSI